MNDLNIYEKSLFSVASDFDQVTDTVSVSGKNIPVETTGLADTVKISLDSVTHPTWEEVRYWHLQQNKKMLINETHYLPSINADLGYYQEVKHDGLELPVHMRNKMNNDWITIVLLLALALLVSVRAGFQKYLGTLFQSVVNYSTSFRMFREKNYSFLHGAFRLQVLYYIIFSIFIYQILVMQQFKNAGQNWIFIGKTTGFIVLYFLLKKFAYWVLGVVFNGISETSEFLFNLDNYNRAASIVLFPIVALIAFYPFGNPRGIILLGILVTGFFYVMLLRRGVIILLKKQFSIYYLFLYLCTLEFLPLLLIYKIVVV